MLIRNPRDERETAIDHAADRLSFLVLAYGVLAIAAWRSFNGDATWDLLVLVIAAGAVGLVYRLRKGAVTRAWSIVAGVSVVAAVIIAAILAAARLPR
jgi:hypothetical protein